MSRVLLGFDTILSQIIKAQGKNTPEKNTSPPSMHALTHSIALRSNLVSSVYILAYYWEMEGKQRTQKTGRTSKLRVELELLGI